MEVMRIEEIETTDKKIKRTWSYEKKDVLKDIESEKSQASPCVKDRVESEINLMKNNSYISKVSSPLAHRTKQKRIDQLEKLHMN